MRRGQFRAEFNSWAYIHFRNADESHNSNKYESPINSHRHLLGQYHGRPDLVGILEFVRQYEDYDRSARYCIRHCCWGIGHSGNPGKCFRRDHAHRDPNDERNVSVGRTNFKTRRISTQSVNGFFEVQNLLRNFVKYLYAVSRYRESGNNTNIIYTSPGTRYLLYCRDLRGYIRTGKWLLEWGVKDDFTLIARRQLAVQKGKSKFTRFLRHFCSTAAIT